MTRPFHDVRIYSTSATASSVASHHEARAKVSTSFEKQRSHTATRLGIKAMIARFTYITNGPVETNHKRTLGTIAHDVCSRAQQCRHQLLSQRHRSIATANTRKTESITTRSNRYCAHKAHAFEPILPQKRSFTAVVICVSKIAVSGYTYWYTAPYMRIPVFHKVFTADNMCFPLSPAIHPPEAKYRLLPSSRQTLLLSFLVIYYGHPALGLSFAQGYNT